MIKKEKPAKSSTVDAVYSQLKQKIISFERYPGTRITELALAEMIGRSRRGMMANHWLA